MTGRIGIDDVSPVVSRGAHPSKAVVGEHVPITATVWREGHDAVAATVVWTAPDGRREAIRMMPVDPGNDRWAATVVPDAEGLWTFRVEGWGDPWSTWLHTVRTKIDAGQGPAELANDLESGARLLEWAARRPSQRANRTLLAGAVTALRDERATLSTRVGPALTEEIGRLLHADPLRELVTRGTTHRVWVDRRRALYGSWYEFFPRSTGGWDSTGRAVHGTFTTAAKELERVAAMGFDVVYLPPIHPIGEVNRKGRNNTLTPAPEDVGSPWAIGSADGGHDAVHPLLGTIDDFDAFVARARELDLEVALDLALQCAPDHPWATEHQEWFTTRPDGTIAYAENPPKKYQDIYPVNFDDDRAGIYAEVLRIVLHWVEHGVRIFRVDNPHTKPPDFWQWLIWKVKQTHPDVLFLAEAFTRPARLYGLARLGFTQSYTYFTWRVFKDELVEFGREQVAHADEARPNLFVNTPDILHESLQQGGPAMFALRAALAATMSPTWGVYSGYELFEHVPVREGSEEYLDSEKYQLRPRDYAGALADGRSLQPWLTRLNEIRRAHPALQQLRTLHFHHTENDALIAYSKTDPATRDTVIVVINLDPFQPADGMVYLDLPALGLEWHDRLTVQDEVTGEVYDWGPANWVRLEPQRAVAHILAVRR
ncbi:MAG TPA: alpha-1,4-glucan--maltose-1-phosphate maltosyltransferase [Pseudonocardiaceae bacterium]